MELNICHLYPDVLNLYGDRGNVICMQKRLQWRGIDCNVEGISIGDPLEASKYFLSAVVRILSRGFCLTIWRDKRLRR